jgi:PLP dependent protein
VEVRGSGCATVLATVLSDRLEQVESRIARAAERAGRSRADITLIAVTKKFPAATMRDAYAAGLREFGENYVQEFEGKAGELSDLAGARFHLIGHLQSNKTRKAAELFQAIQTIDSPKLARRLDTEGRAIDVMIEVKLSGEDGKSGCAPEEIGELIPAIRACPNLRLRGLMTMPPWSDDPEAPRPYFIRLRQLAEQHGLKDLSMGMSHDLETAIEEGATMVRVGTALFGPRVKT